LTLGVLATILNQQLQNPEHPLAFRPFVMQIRRALIPGIPEYRNTFGVCGFKRKLQSINGR
jgi:hypothetical protein